jgi:hypothetical protein
MAVRSKSSEPLGSEIAEATKEASTEGGKTKIAELKIAELMSDFFAAGVTDTTRALAP